MDGMRRNDPKQPAAEKKSGVRRSKPSSGRSIRSGWEEAFTAAGDARDDEMLLDCLPPNDFDADEWSW